MQGYQTTLLLKAIGEQVDVGTCKNLLELLSNANDVESWKLEVQYRIHLNKLMQKLVETLKWKAQQWWCKASPHSLQWARHHIFRPLNPRYEQWKYKIHLNKLMQELVGTCKNFQVKSLTMMAQNFPPLFATREMPYLSYPKPWIYTMKIHIQNSQILRFRICISQNQILPDTDTHIHITDGLFCWLCIETFIRKETTSRYDSMHIQQLVCMCISRLYHISG